jgi:hypothetical protein
VASFDDTGTPGSIFLHEYRLIAGDLHAFLIVHMGSFLGAADTGLLRAGWCYEPMPAGPRRPLGDVTITPPEHDRPYCRVEVKIGRPVAGVLSWASGTVGTVESFSKSYGGPETGTAARARVSPSTDAAEALWWAIAVCCLMFAVLAVLVVVRTRTP